MGFPNLETERLIIRPFTLDDLEAIHRIPDLELNWAGEPLTREDRKEILERIITGSPPLCSRGSPRYR